MSYSLEQCKNFSEGHGQVCEDIQSLVLEGAKQARALTNKKARDHLNQGAGRRLSVIRRSIDQIFNLFPPNQKSPLPRETVEDVQIYLHAFAINLYGTFDNWAWAFLLRHDLVAQIGSRTDIGMFRQKTQKYLPAVLRAYLGTESIVNWHKTYLKEYRDALVHRIPLYVPPALWSVEDGRLYEELESEKLACIESREWDRLDEVWSRQDRLGKACPVFMHEYSEEAHARPVFLHPQLICDAKSVVEFGKLYLAEWHVCS